MKMNTIPGRRPRSKNGTHETNPKYQVRCEPKTVDTAKGLALALGIPIQRVFDEAIALMFSQVSADAKSGAGRYCSTITRSSPSAVPVDYSALLQDGELHGPNDAALNLLEQQQAVRRRRRDELMGRRTSSECPHSEETSDDGE